MKKKLLITGGTGSFGKHFLKSINNLKNNYKEIVIFRRDELKQFLLRQDLKEKTNIKYKFIIGDIRDREKLFNSFKNIDDVLHTAALKQVDTAEMNPEEYIKTNIIGTQNVIDASVKNSVKKVVSLSTDKASSPINLYGATKLCADKLLMASNFNENHSTKFSIARYGNVMFSRGSIAPFLIDQNLNNNYFTITNKEMTRFNITLSEAVKFVNMIFSKLKGGEIFVPKIPSFKIIDLAKAINLQKKIKFIGIRPGEKIHEEMISKNDSKNTYDCGKYYVIYPNHKYFKKSKKVSKNFSYSSDKNKFLNLNQLRKLLKDKIF